MQLGWVKRDVGICWCSVPGVGHSGGLRQRGGEAEGFPKWPLDPRRGARPDDRSGSSEFFLDDPDDFDGAGGPLPSEPAQRQSAEAASWSSEEAMKEPEVLKTLKELHGRNDDSDDEEALEDLERLRRIGWGGLQPSGESQDDNFDPGFDPGSGPVGKDLPAAPPAAAGWAAFAPAAQPPAFQADFGGPAVPPADFQADFGGAAAPAAPPDAGFVADFGGWPGEGAAGGPPAKAAFEGQLIIELARNENIPESSGVQAVVAVVACVPPVSGLVAELGAWPLPCSRAGLHHRAPLAAPRPPRGPHGGQGALGLISDIPGPDSFGRTSPRLACGPRTQLLRPAAAR
ncbi:unnamed protein product [Prorocentrum cordatum]|uniref:Uncharacterized protein n=1 Tax=Prorocentrum cordatum TaxID=2364126 RepID=A0ABN9RJV2_9DINO|nr:unnamed protein product [Polarella glacialis]